MKQGTFRIWVQNLWLEHRDENEGYKQDPGTLKEYWDKYKYWIKREYRHQQKSQNQ